MNRFSSILIRFALSVLALLAYQAILIQRLFIQRSPFSLGCNLFIYYEHVQSIALDLIDDLSAKVVEVAAPVLLS